VGELAATVGFQEVLDKVITNNCLECHSTYSNYTISAQLAPKMLETVLSGRMPKGGPRLDQDLIDTLQTWVLSGAPEEAGGEEAQEIPLAPTFESIQVNILAPKCLSCHSGNPDAPAPLHIDFSSYEALLTSDEMAEIISGERLLNSDTPEESFLTYLLSPGSDGAGVDPAMPPRTVPGTPEYEFPGYVTPEEIKVINEWMKKGYPEK